MTTRVTPLGLGPVRRIAVLRALVLGDLLCAVPTLRAVRAGFPDAEITLVGLGWARELVDRFDTYLDGFLELPGWPGLPEREPDLAAIPGFLAEAHARRFDLVLQLHGSGEVTNPLAVLLGGCRTAGFYRPSGYCPDPATFAPYPDAGTEPRRLLALAEHLGLPLRGDRLEFPLREADREALAAVPAADLLEPGAYACVHPGARLESRRWGPSGFAAVADGLARCGLEVVLTGSEGERALTVAVAAAMEEPAAVDLAGQTSLGALAALLADARVLVCNDTGVSHLAAALGVPSVVVVTTSDPDRWAPLDASRHRPVRAEHAGAAGILREVDRLLAGDGRLETTAAASHREA